MEAKIADIKHAKRIRSLLESMREKAYFEHNVWWINENLFRNGHKTVRRWMKDHGYPEEEIEFIIKKLNESPHGS